MNIHKKNCKSKQIFIFLACKVFCSCKEKHFFKNIIFRDWHGNYVLIVIHALIQTTQAAVKLQKDLRSRIFPRSQVFPDVSSTFRTS